MRQLGMIYAVGMKFLLLSVAIYALGSGFFYMPRNEQAQPNFTAREQVLFAIVVCAGVTGVYALMTSPITVGAARHMGSCHASSLGMANALNAPQPFGKLLDKFMEHKGADAKHTKHAKPPMNSFT